MFAGIIISQSGFNPSRKADLYLPALAGRHRGVLVIVAEHKSAEPRPLSGFEQRSGLFVIKPLRKAESYLPTLGGSAPGGQQMQQSTRVLSPDCCQA